MYLNSLIQVSGFKKESSCLSETLRLEFSHVLTQHTSYEHSIDHSVLLFTYRLPDIKPPKQRMWNSAHHMSIQCLKNTPGFQFAFLFVVGTDPPGINT